MHNNPTPRSGRRGPLRADASLVDKMDRKVSRKAGRAIYRRRQAIIEPVFGQIKDARGIRRFMRRGKAAADSEWKLIAGTHNILKLYRRVLTGPQDRPLQPDRSRDHLLTEHRQPRATLTGHQHPIPDTPISCPRPDHDSTPLPATASQS